MLYLLPLDPVLELMLPTLWLERGPLYIGSAGGSGALCCCFLMLLRASFLEPMVFTDDNKGLLLP